MLRLYAVYAGRAKKLRHASAPSSSYASASAQQHSSMRSMQRSHVAAAASVQLSIVESALVRESDEAQHAAMDELGSRTEQLEWRRNELQSTAIKSEEKA